VSDMTVDFLLPSARGTLPARITQLSADTGGTEQLMKSRTLPTSNGHAHDRPRDVINSSTDQHDVTEDRTVSGTRHAPVV